MLVKVLFQGRWLSLQIEDFGLFKRTKGKGFRCAEHTKDLKDVREIETHLKADHWPGLSKLWIGGEPA